MTRPTNDQRVLEGGDKVALSRKWRSLVFPCIEDKLELRVKGGSVRLRAAMPGLSGARTLRRGLAAQARWRPVEVAAPAQSLFLRQPPWRDKRIRCSGRFTRTGRTGSTLRSSPAASRKSRTFSTLSVSGRAGEAGRREASEAADGAEERRVSPATRFLFRSPPAHVPSP